MKRLVLSVLVVITFAACEAPTGVSDLPVPDMEPPVFSLETAAATLVAHWTLDEGSGTVAGDASGYGNSGTLMNGPTWVPGYTGTALSFDGDDDFVLVPDADALDLAGDFTISLFLNWSNENRDADILRKGSAGTASHFYKVELKYNVLRVRLVGDRKAITLKDPQIRDDGSWYNVAVTRQGGWNRLYVDGVVVDSTFRNVGNMSNSANLAIGAKDTGDDDFYEGLIDDVRLYSRALTIEEIGELVNSGDDTPPAVPQNVAASALSSAEIQVSWDPSSDPESGVSSYKIYRDGVFVGQSLTTPFIDSELTASTTYIYEVSAVNGAGLESAKGGPAAATTLGDDDPPGVPENVAADPLSAFQIQVSWDPSSDPESGVSHYEVYRDGVSLGQSLTTTLTDGGLTPATTYVYEVSAVNGAGLESAKGGPAQATTLYDDDTPPAVPQNVAAEPLSAFQMQVSWDPSSDLESGVSSYSIYRDGAFVGASQTATFTDAGLTPATTYVYEVSAVNGAGLESARGGPAQATTLPFAGPPGIVAHWTFDEGSGNVAGDASGNGNVGTLMNGPIWVPGYSGTALSFDGDDDFVLVPDDDALDLAGDFTISIWVNWINNNIDADVLRKGNTRNASDWYLIEISDNHIHARLNGSSGGTNLDQVPILNDGVWHHVAVVRDASSNRIYVDGVLRDDSGRNLGDLSNSNNLTFGSKDTGDEDFFNGMIDDIRFYNRALTEQEITDLGNLGGS
ncbi:MAG: fibronectin type III domain-containing protein [Gemmatimonadota bacterium]|nr:fibronectin type III domain-containing protein [Gemmatimonadota bacterium]